MKNKESKEEGNKCWDSRAWGEVETSLHRMLSDNLPENMTFEPRCEEQAVRIYGVESVSKRNDCQGPEVVLSWHVQETVRSQV